MRRILFSWRGFHVYSYPAMLYLGLVAGVFVGAHVAQLSGVSADRFAVAQIILIIPALAGARLYFVLSRWSEYRAEPRRIWRRSEGGMAMYGGLILAVPLSIPLLRAFDLPFGTFWDASMFTILVGMAFTRVGCLLNGCCSGRPTTGWLGLDLPDHNGVRKRRIPTQLIEIAWTALLLAAAFVLRPRAPFPGAILCFILISYGAARAFLETLREDATGGRDRIFMQATSVLFLIAGLAGLALVWI
jgi:prolipoprotein diacylglyceryl transferase